LKAAAACHPASLTFSSRRPAVMLKASPHLLMPVAAAAANHLADATRQQQKIIIIISPKTTQ